MLCMPTKKEERKMVGIPIPETRKWILLYIQYNCTGISKTGVHLIKKEKQAFTTLFILSHFKISNGPDTSA